LTSTGLIADPSPGVTTDGTIIRTDQHNLIRNILEGLDDVNYLQVKYPSVTKAIDYTIVHDDVIILGDTNGGDVTLTLPSALVAGIIRKLYIIKKIDPANNLIIDGNGTETIDGALTKTLTADNESVSIVSDGANWHIISDAALPSAGEANTHSSVGGGTFDLTAATPKVGVDLRLISISNGDGINAALATDVLTLAVASTVVQTDQTNTFGAFAQIFPSTQLQLQSNGNEYIFAGSAIIADRTVTLPLLTGNDVFVTQAFIQPLTNKVIDDFSNTVHADSVHIQVRNESGGAITIGQVVFISGYSVGQDLPLVVLADASSTSTMPALGIVADTSIANNANGQVTITGRLAGINTSAFSVGDTIYVSETPGALTTRPTGSTVEVQNMGLVLRSHASLGVIEVASMERSNDIPNSQSDAIFQISDDGDITKALDFQLSGATTGTIMTIVSSQTVARSLTLPDATDTLMGKATTDVMTNKSYDLGGTGNVLTGSVAEFNTALQSDTFMTFASTNVVTGAVQITAGTMRIPLSTTPTMAVDGDFAIDTLVTDFSHGIMKYFDGEELGVISMPIAQFGTPTGGHVISYNATNDEFELVAAGAADNLGNHTATEIIKSVTFGLQGEEVGHTIIATTVSNAWTYNVPTGDIHDFQVNTISQMTISATTIDFQSNTLTDIADITSITNLNGVAIGNYAISTDNLSVFAATTSAQLAGVISDETGSGLLVFGTSPTIVTPTIASFANANHSHLNSAGGGTITEAAISNLGTAVALVADNLSVFAATTSAQLAGVISDETGSGLLVFGTSPTIVTPTIASFANATHSHLNAAGGGTITEASISDLQTYLVNVVEDTTPQLGGAFDGQGNDLNNMGVLFLTEQAAAEVDVAGKGQTWVLTAVPNVLMFTDDVGTDFTVANTATTLDAFAAAAGIVDIGTQTLDNVGRINAGILSDETGTIASITITDTTGIMTLGANILGNDKTIENLASLDTGVIFDETGTVASITITDITGALLLGAALTTAAIDVAGNNIDNIQNLILDQSVSGTDIDFTEDMQQTISIAANTTFTGVNYAIGVSKTVFITTDASIRTLTFPAGWIFQGVKPTEQAASKVGTLTLTCTTAAEAGIRCAYAVEA